MRMNVVIRRAREGEEAAINRLLVETWHDTYDAILGREKVADITARWHAPERLAEQIGLEGAAFLVAEADGGILGHAFARMDREGIVHLFRLYVHPAHQRAGIGGLLLDAVAGLFPRAPAIRLEVEEENVKGRRFYEAHGFSVVGRTGDCGGDSNVPALVMEKRW
jgi:ribosomal protein S18 acetylase RimI-like enzyme